MFRVFFAIAASSLLVACSDKGTDDVGTDAAADVAVADSGQDMQVTDLRSLDLGTDLNTPDACAPSCVDRQCGPDGCGGTCGPGCADDLCGVAEDFLDAHATEQVSALEDAMVLAELPAQTSALLPTGTLSFCPDGGCFLAVSIGNIQLAQPTLDTVVGTFAVTSWSADSAGVPTPWPYDVDFGLGNIACTANLDSRLSEEPELGSAITVRFALNPATAEARLTFEEPSIAGFDDGDWQIGDNLTCENNALAGFVIDSLVAAVQGAWASHLGELVCGSCNVDADCLAGEICDGACWDANSCRTDALTPLCGA